MQISGKAVYSTFGFTFGGRVGARLELGVAASTRGLPFSPPNCPQVSRLLRPRTAAVAGRWKPTKVDSIYGKEKRGSGRHIRLASHRTLWMAIDPVSVFVEQPKIHFDSGANVNRPATFHARCEFPLRNGFNSLLVKSVT
jgi:hypothetical protein